MKSWTKASKVAALLGLLALAEASNHRHGHFHQQHRSIAERGLERRGGQCQFPSNAGLVAVTPDQQNAGWAMPPDRPCTPGSYCPYACPPGQVSMQWNPEATAYTYPISMDGGLYCDESGNIQKPFPNNPYCVDGTGAVAAVNKCGKPLSFCQTVLPGSESMLIPTLVEDTADLAVPGPSYWLSTAAHFYVNGPGVGTEGCIWGTSANPIGNWAYFVAGANTDNSGNTFVKIGYNPVVLEPATPFRNTPANYGIEIICEDGANCNGLPCAIDPSKDAINQITGSGSDGAGGGAFCVVTVPKGSKASIVVFETGNSGGGSGSGSGSSSASPVSSSSTTTTTTTSSSTSSTSSTPSTSSTSTSTSSSSSSSTEASTTSISSSTSKSTSTPLSATTTPSSNSISAQSLSASYSYAPHVFVENPSSSGAVATATQAKSESSSSAPTPTPSKGAASVSTISTLGCLMGLVAGVMFHI